MHRTIAILLAIGTCLVSLLSLSFASAADQQPLHVLVTGRGAGPGSIEEMWRPLVDQYGMRISVAFTMHVNSYYADHGNERAAGILPKDQEEQMIALLLPGGTRADGASAGSPLRKEGERPVDVAIIGGRVTANPDQYSQFDREKETWHPGTLTPALQEALVKYVKAGGKLIFSTLQIFTTTRVTAKHVYEWKGGPLDDILPTDELKDNLPFMDGRPRELWGTVSFRQIGDGKVIIVDPHTPSPTVAETKRREFELWDSLVRWMARGDAEFPATVAADLPERTIPAGSPLAVSLTVRNYASDDTVWLKLTVLDPNGQECFVRESAVKVERGKAAVEPASIPTANIWLSGRYSLAIQLRTGKKVVASLAEPFDVAGILDLAVKPDKDGYEQPGPVGGAIEIRNSQKRPYRDLRLRVWLRDCYGRVFEQQMADVNLPAQELHTQRVVLTMQDFPRGVYWIEAAISSGKECWGRGSGPVYRYGPHDPDDEIVWTMWTYDHSQQWLDLYRDTGLNTICSDFAAAEHDGFKVWTRSMYCLNLGEALPEDQLKAKFNELFAKPLPGRRDPSVWHPALTMVCQDGENGWPILLHGAAQKAPFTQWLRKHYPSLEALNAAWGKTYASWDDIECAEPSSGYGVSAPRDAPDPARYRDQQQWIMDQQFRYHQVWTESLRAACPYGVGTSATACAWSNGAGTSVIDFQCAQPWISTTDWFWQATKGRELFGNMHGRSTHWAFIANRPILSTAFWGAIAAGSRFIDMWTPVFPERTRYPSWDGTFNIYQPSCKHSPASLDIKGLIEQISRKQRVLLDSWTVVSDSVAYYESQRGAAAEFGLFGHVFHSGYLPNLVTGPSADLKKYKVVLATGASAVTPETARLLRDYVAGGGFLVTFPGFATTDERGKRFDSAPALGLNDVTGFKFAPQPPDKLGDHIVIKGQTGLPLGTRIAVWPNASVQGGITDAADDLGILAEYEGTGVPALTFHKYGEGRAVHVNFGTQCGPAYAGQNRFVWRDESWEELRLLLNRILEWGKASRPLVLLDPGGRGLPNVNATMLATKDGSVRYLLVCSDYRQEHSLALDRQTFNSAREKVLVKAAELRQRNNVIRGDDLIILPGADSWAETEIKIPATGRYQLWLDAWFDRPAEQGRQNALAISIDGKNDPPDNASGDERLLFGNTPIFDRWLWQSGRWFDLEKGRHVLRLTGQGSPVRVRNVLLISPPALAMKAYLTEKPVQAFDVYAEQEVKLEQDNRGTFIPVCLQPGEAKVFSLLPYRAGELGLSIDSGSEDLGRAFTVTVSKDTPGTHSIRVTVTGPNDAELRALRREFPLRDRAVLRFITALNDPPGRWTVTAEDETTGQRVQQKIKMKK